MNNTTTQEISYFRSQQFLFLRLFMALALMPVILLGIITYWQATINLARTADENMGRFGQVQHQRVHDWVDNLAIQVQLLAKDDDIMSMDPEQATEVIHNFVKTIPDLETVLLADRSGQVIAADSEESLSLNIVDRDYFIRAMKGEANFSDALISRLSGNVILVRAEPIRQNGQVVGVLAVVTPTSEITQMLEQTWTGQTGDAFLINQQGLLLTAPRFSDELKEAGKFEERPELEVEIKTEAAEAALAGEEGVIHSLDYRGEPAIIAYLAVERVNWGLIVKMDEAEALSSVSALRLITLGLVLAIVVLVGLIAVWASRSLSLPILWIAEGAQHLAKGESVDSKMLEPIAQRQDELGLAGKAFRDLAAYFGEMGSAAEKIAAGDLNVSVEPRSQQDRFGNAFSQMIATLSELINQVKQNADQVSSASEQLASVANQSGQATSQVAATIQQVAKGTSQQSESISRTATSVEQMSRAIDEVTRGSQDQSRAVIKAAEITRQIANAIQQVSANAKAGTRGSEQAAEIAKGGAETINATLQGMETIQSKVNLSAQKVREMGTRSEQIGVIVSTIEDLASQTNLLALNAAIEAARAGEHGKGFAVVADEVRKLAERSSLATKEIGGLVKDIQHTVNDAVTAMDDGSSEVERGVEQASEAGEALEKILGAAREVNRQVVQIATAADHMTSLSNELVAATDAVSAAVEENTAATEEMAAGSTEVTRAIENIASVSEENSAAVEEVSASAEEMSAQVEEVTASAQSLAEMAQALQQIVAQFKLTAEVQTHKKGTHQLHEPMLQQTKLSHSTYKSNGHSAVRTLPDPIRIHHHE